MKTRVAVSCLSLLAGTWALPAAEARAEKTGGIESPGALLLAEIVVPTQPESGQKTKKSAAEARAKAKAYQESDSAYPTPIVIPEDQEEGLLGPRRQPDSGATGAAQNRARARQYQQGQGTTLQAPVPMVRDPANPAPTTAERAQESSARARSYVSTDNKVVIQRIGSDGIPIVTCGKVADNVAGRIGDDVQPGGIFFVIRDNKPFKVRCAQ